ncbi:transcriptional regulator [Candidatus Woesearchaeota archaeon]|jgi:hypothetical protein|nr:transcriptional regulator [Candidatus Woesearchaeota archaeon]
MAIPRYWRNTQHYYNLIGSKCKKCGRVYFPQRSVCADDDSAELEEHPLSREGKILTFTVLRTSLSDPSKENTDVIVSEMPLVLAIIELEKGVNVTAPIIECEPEDIKIGSKVEAVFRKIMEKGEKGILGYSYKFRLMR